MSISKLKSLALAKTQSIIIARSNAGSSEKGRKIEDMLNNSHLFSSFVTFRY